jgi:hypothetical protein
MNDSFNVTSGKLVISDPCYRCDENVVQDYLKVVKAKNGKWFFEVCYSDEGPWGDRVAGIIARHESYQYDESLKRGVMIKNLCVDSGQMSIVDFEHYKNDEDAKDFVPNLTKEWGDHYCENEGDEWYRMISEISLSEESAGCFEHGCVSSSGFGDGSYNGLVTYDGNNEAIKIDITFIEDEDSYDEFE